MTATERSTPRARRARGALDDELRDRVVARLAHADQRFTRQREALLSVLAIADRPLTIPEIGQHDPGLAMSSIYRNLTNLEEVGVVHRIVTDGDFADFELAEDLTQHHHHHLVCSKCGAVEDFEATAALEAAVRDAARRVGHGSRFRTQRHLVDLIGLCANCS